MQNNELIINQMPSLPESIQAVLDHYTDTVVKGLKEQYEVLKEKIEYLETKQPVNPVIISFLFSQRKSRVIKLLGGKESNAYRDAIIRSATYREAANAFKKRYKIPRYDLLSKKDQDSAMFFWHDWAPSEELIKRINKANQSGD